MYKAETQVFRGDRRKRWIAPLIGAFSLVAIAIPSRADGGVVFTDGADEAGISYERTPSPRLAIHAGYNAQSPIPSPRVPMLQANSPQKDHGAPGLVIWDYDNDGDLDIYVTNGPGTANSLFQNQLAQSGAMTFVDVAAAANVELVNQDSSGACFGDIDNDGDPDLYVLGTGQPNVLLRNEGDGTFSNVTARAGVAGIGTFSAGCSMGDIDNDGFLDIVVANTYNTWKNRRAVFVAALYPRLEPNDLFRNNRNGTFTDVSATSGIRNIEGLDGGSYTWAIAMVDYDQDGDLDILQADTQGSPPPTPADERGFNRLFENDGHGNFTDVTRARGLAVWGSWMGLSFGDLNCDSSLDFFSTNLGRYMGGPTQNSRWFFGSADKSFSDPGVGALMGTPFGWGTTILDYDNDGDPDISLFGDDEVFTFIAADNPGTVLRNEGLCSGTFTWDQAAMTTDHRLRQVHGVAAGDLNGDGFEDLVTVANLKFTFQNFRPMTVLTGGPTGAPFDAVARLERQISPVPNPGFGTYVNPDISNGNLVIDINGGDNGNSFVELEVVGTKGLVNRRFARGTVNRSGIGALVYFHPEGLPRSFQPVVGGASYGSQDSLIAHFGMGEATTGTADVVWPGGTRNRLYNVAAGERLTLPEIPCDYVRFVPLSGSGGPLSNRSKYKVCVEDALRDVTRARVITSSLGARILSSALRAYDENH